MHLPKVHSPHIYFDDTFTFQVLNWSLAWEAESIRQATSPSQIAWEHYYTFVWAALHVGETWIKIACLVLLWLTGKCTSLISHVHHTHTYEIISFIVFLFHKTFHIRNLPCKLRSPSPNVSTGKVNDIRNCPQSHDMFHSATDNRQISLG